MVSEGRDGSRCRGMVEAPMVCLENCQASSGNMWGIAVEKRCAGPTCLLSNVSRLCETKSWNANCESVPVCQELPRAGGPCSNPRRLGGHLPHNSIFVSSSLLNLVPARGICNGVFFFDRPVAVSNRPRSSKPSGCTFSMTFSIWFSIPCQASLSPTRRPLATHSLNPVSLILAPPTSPLILDSTSRELWQ